MWLCSTVLLLPPLISFHLRLPALCPFRLTSDLAGHANLCWQNRELAAAIINAQKFQQEQNHFQLHPEVAPKKLVFSNLMLFKG